MLAYPPIAAMIAMRKVLTVNFGTLLSSRFGLAIMAAISVLVWSNGMFMPPSVCLMEEPEEDDILPSFFDLRKPMLRVSIQCVVENRVSCLSAIWRRKTRGLGGEKILYGEDSSWRKPLRKWDEYG